MPSWTTLLLVVAGFVPSIVWLAIYLTNDSHPEPKSRLIKTFVMSLILALVAALAQELFVKSIRHFDPSYIFENSKIFYLWAAFVEEFIKFTAVFFIALRSVDFDEPVDAMIYMITAGLGFAALENTLFLFDSFNTSIQSGATVATSLTEAFKIWMLRFFGATLLHTLASGILGYFLALAWFYHHHSKKIITLGIIAASLFHFAFNLGFILFDSGQTGQSLYAAFVSSSALLGGMIVLVAVLFYKIKVRTAASRSTVYLSTSIPVSTV